MAAPARLRSVRDIRAVLQGGRTEHTRAAVVHARPRAEGVTRATVVAGRRVGSAVTRNRAKRRLRSALQAADVPSGFDLVVVARPAAVSTPFPELVATLRRALAKVARD